MPYRPGFRDRPEAGRELAHHLMGLRSRGPVVLALPRGGVPVAYEIARALRAPLDLLLVRKIGAPEQPEYALGAVVDSTPPQIVLNQEAMEELSVRPDYLEEQTRREIEEMERRRAAYLGGRRPVDLRGRTVILVDDGIATGSTVMAALRALKQAGPATLILAVPVAPRDVIERLRGEADQVVCPLRPDPFCAVGAHYDDFSQTSDREVIDLLDAARAWSGETERRA